MITENETGLHCLQIEELNTGADLGELIIAASGDSYLGVRVEIQDDCRGGEPTPGGRWTCYTG